MKFIWFSTFFVWLQFKMCKTFSKNVYLLNSVLREYIKSFYYIFPILQRKQLTTTLNIINYSNIYLHQQTNKNAWFLKFLHKFYYSTNHSMLIFSLFILKILSPKGLGLFSSFGYVVLSHVPAVWSIKLNEMNPCYYDNIFCLWVK